MNYLMQSRRSGIFADWVAVTVPQIELDELGITDKIALGETDDLNLTFQTSTGQKFPAIFHRRKGRQGASYRVCMPFPTRLVAGYMTSESPAKVSFVKAQSVMGIKSPTPVGLSLRSTTVVEKSAAEIVERFAFASEKETVIIWRRIRSMHPVVEYGVRWSRRYDDGWMPSVIFPDVQEMHLVPGHDWQDITIAGNAVKPPNMVDSRCAPTVWLRAIYGEEGTEGPIETQLRSTVIDPAPLGVYQGYTQFAEDADEIPTFVGDARWLTLGILPHEDSAALDRALDEERLATTSIYDKRLGAQALSANQAGTQRFGCAEGGAIAISRPHDAERYLRQMAGDEELRPIHYYELDGSIVDPGKHMNLRTHNRRIDWRNSQDRLWFQTEPPRITSASKRTTDDEQHMDDLGIDAYLAVFDDPALEETRRLMVRLDACDTQTLNGRTNSAARGVGRPMLSAANAAWLFDGTDDGLLAQATVQLLLSALVNTWEGKKVPIGRPVRPVATIKGNASWNLRHPWTEEPMRAAACYEHATVGAGCLAAAQVLRGDKRALALHMVKMIGETLMAWRYTSHEGGNVQTKWPFIVACLEGDEDGQTLPAAWKDDRTHAFTMTHVPGGSWTTWTMPGVLAYMAVAELPPDVEGLVKWMLINEAHYKPLVSRFMAIDYQALSHNE